MPGTKLVLYLGVITIALVHVMNKQSDRRASGSALENARENLDLIGFLALRRVARRSRATTIQVELQVARFQRHAGWATINNTAERNAVAFTKRRYDEILPNTITRH
jgi:hypothetical protein